MNKSDFCQLLIDDIKDDIEFDSDIIALKSLLLKMLEYDDKKSFDNWKYLILKYDISDLSIDVDFMPIVNDYPEKLIDKVGLETFWNYMKEIPIGKTYMVYDVIFNIFNPKCFIYKILENYVKMNDKKSELIFVKNILNKSKAFSKLFFSKTELIRKIIILHIDNKFIPLDFIQELIEIVDNRKEKAVLKALLIDYLDF